MPPGGQSATEPPEVRLLQGRVWGRRPSAHAFPHQSARCHSATSAARCLLRRTQPLSRHGRTRGYSRGARAPAGTARPRRPVRHRDKRTCRIAMTASIGGHPVIRPCRVMPSLNRRESDVSDGCAVGNDRPVLCSLAKRKGLVYKARSRCEVGQVRIPELRVKIVTRPAGGKQCGRIFRRPGAKKDGHMSFSRHPWLRAQVGAQADPPAGAVCGSVVSSLPIKSMCDLGIPTDVNP